MACNIILCHTFEYILNGALESVHKEFILYNRFLAKVIIACFNYHNKGFQYHLNAPYKLWIFKGESPYQNMRVIFETSPLKAWEF